MRGVVSGAMLIALRELGMDRIFDSFHGASAASINLTFFAQGASWDALSMYYDYLPKNLFRRFPRAFSSPLDMNYLDGLFSGPFPIHQPRMRELGLNVRILVTNVDECTSEEIDISTTDDPVAMMKAGAWLPVIAGRPMEHAGKRLLDGGVLVAHPLYAAEEHGATHILALSPAADAARTGHSRTLRTATAGILNHWQPGLGAAYLDSRRRWEIDKIALCAGAQGSLGAKVQRLTPHQGAHKVTRLTTELGVLVEGARAGYASIRRRYGSDTTGEPHFEIRY